MKKNSNISLFLGEELLKAHQNDVGISFLNSTFIDFNSGEKFEWSNPKHERTYGYFDYKPREIKIAFSSKQNLWLKTFLHESCHLDQFLEKSQLWNHMIYGKTDMYKILFDWLQHKKIPKNADIEKSVKKIFELEKDCEERAVKKIIKYSLPFNKINYIKQANAYILSYKLSLLERNFYKRNKEPYNIEDVWKKMPSNFDYTFDTIKDKHLKIIKDSCFP